MFGKSKKEAREYEVLIGLVELYLESGKPIGSNTLRENGFKKLSSATIRNYFSSLEERGLLTQLHSSGGRTPTNEAFRVYAKEVFESEAHFDGLPNLGQLDKKEIHSYLQNVAEKLSEVTGYATFLSSVRFDHDFIMEVKLVGIDAERLLCVILTDFGQILTEVLPTSKKLSSFALKRIESILQWHIRGGTKPVELSDSEEVMAKKLYNEIMVRYLVRYSNFSEDELFKTGFSRLLAYPEFNEAVALSTGLSLFENGAHMRLLLNDCVREDGLNYWIGSDLAPYATAAKGCSVVTIPYSIGNTKVGAIGILGPCRMPYDKVFGTLRFFSNLLSQSLTKSLSKFKLSFRQPRSHTSIRQHEDIVDQTSNKLLEVKYE
ncbi:MAG: Heat-inducible transcription repressor HrcA [Chlamydiales bacterium]|nr:Heat-inducible transcription repressor HrcA [Chlamydiales bacterium]MCH9620038.1 Heat-inducible transcription repressor HrcA [Chlamydiales bacterium]MCH9622859.1 Heat-inducible transcription repressor HrcA [Chlamydiales bacterium]